MTRYACDCYECQRARSGHRRIPHHDARAEERANELLASFLLPVQLEDYQRNGGINVRGSDKRLYRIRPDVYHQGFVREDGFATSVWIVDQRFGGFSAGDLPPADQVLGLMLYTLNDAPLVTRSGCHMQYHAPQYLPTDYDGAI